MGTRFILYRVKCASRLAATGRKGLWNRGSAGWIGEGCCRGGVGMGVGEETKNRAFAREGANIYSFLLTTKITIEPTAVSSSPFHFHSSFS